MLLGKKSIGLALAGLAAYAYYRYSKMTEDQKRDLSKNFKEKGRKIFDSIVPSSRKQGMNSSEIHEYGSQYAG
jgi:hypothetical protein